MCLENVHVYIYYVTNFKLGNVTSTKDASYFLTSEKQTKKHSCPGLIRLFVTHHGMTITKTIKNLYKKSGVDLGF